MTQEEYYNTDWHRGNMVRLNNGKEYQVRSVKKKLLVLFSEEFKKHFTANWNIIECRTSDATLDEECLKAPAETPMPAKKKRQRICVARKHTPEKIDY